VVACVIIAGNCWAVACWPPLSNVPPLAGDAQVAGMSDADIAAKIKSNEKHKSFIAKLSDADVAAVGTFAKGLATGK